MVEIVFLVSVALILYIYLGYPLLAAVLGGVLRRSVHKDAIEPQVTIAIAAYNEESIIAATIRNKLELDYPPQKIEIIVVSDGSTDGTDAIVLGFTDRVRLLRQEPRAGKTSALNLVVSQAQGDIIVFSDANSLYKRDALRKLVSNFADPEVGYVTGKMIYANPDGMPIGKGCGAYMKYENALRSIETRLGSVVGVDGGVDAVRAKLYRPMRPDLLPDFVLPLKVVEQGYRVVYEPEALLWEQSLKEASDEYRMRVRVSLRALWALLEMRSLLGWRRPLFAWELWSHKVLRYLCFVFLISSYLSNALLLRQGAFFQAFFLLQNVIYFAALTVPHLERYRLNASILTFSRYFLLLNVAAAHAFAKFILGKKQVLWTPRKG